MSKIIFVRGIPGSGKSTYARAWAEEDPEHRIRINWDDMRTMFGKYWVPSRETLVKEASITILRKAIASGFDVVIDNMNLSKSSTSDFISIAEQNHCEIEYVDFKTPLEVCIERDSKRANSIGSEIITDIYNRNLNFYKDNDYRYLRENSSR